MDRAAVIINELGDIAIDHQLVAASSEQMTLLGNGCLCCTVRTDLQETLRELFIKRRAGEVIVQVASHASLLPGTTVTVRVGSERRKVLAVPRSAVQDDNYVIVVENGRTQMRPVQLGGELPDGRLEVTGGLTAGERLRGVVP